MTWRRKDFLTLLDIGWVEENGLLVPIFYTFPATPVGVWDLHINILYSLHLVRNAHVSWQTFLVLNSACVLNMTVGTGGVHVMQHDCSARVTMIIELFDSKPKMFSF